MLNFWGSPRIILGKTALNYKIATTETMSNEIMQIKVVILKHSTWRSEGLPDFLPCYMATVSASISLHAWLYASS